MKSIEKKSAVIFTDGACKRNPGPGGWGVVFFLPQDASVAVFEYGGYVEHTTNNRMELIAILESLKSLPPNIPCHLYSDSRYALSAITEYMPRWQRNSWKTATGDPVANVDLLQKIEQCLQSEQRKKRISWHHLYGHSGQMGNERADQIAQAFASQKDVKLFSGDLTEYFYDPYKETTTEQSPKSKPWYISLVDGKLEKHKTWPQCAERVKGHKNARFRKILDLEQEKKILLDWEISF